nr:glycosyltransferase family 4 protein [Devosia sp. BK]
MLPVPPTLGGAVEHWVHRLSDYWKPDNANLSIISRPSDAPGLAGVSYIGVPWRRYEQSANDLKQASSQGSLPRLISKTIVSLSYNIRTRPLARSFDVLIIQNDPIALLMLNKRPEQAVILHMHNDHLTSRGPSRYYDKALDKADKVIFVSDYVKRRAASAFAHHAHRFTTVLNGTDLVEAPSIAPANRPFILFAGRLVDEKGPHILLEAFSRIASEFPMHDLVLAGSSFFGNAPTTAYERRLRSLVHNLSDRVKFTGFLGRRELNELYATTDAVIVPSIWQDPCPLTVLEGMAAGRTVIATRVGGIPELITHGENGRLAMPDATSLAEEIRTTLSQPSLREAMGRNAREEIRRRFQWSRVVADFDAVVNEVRR